MDANLRLLVWFGQANQVGFENRVQIYRREHADYGNAASGILLEIARREFAAPNCTLPFSQYLLRDSTYIDDLLSSLKLLKVYFETCKDLGQACSKAGLTQKYCLKSGKTDPKVLEKK